MDDLEKLKAEIRDEMFRASTAVSLLVPAPNYYEAEARIRRTFMDRIDALVDYKD